MSQEIYPTGDMRKRFDQVISRFNAGEDEALLSLFSDELMFSAPMLKGEHDRDGTWGLGKAAFRDYVLLYREKLGHIHMVDLFAAGNSVSILVEDDRDAAIGRRFKSLARRWRNVPWGA